MSKKIYRSANGKTVDLGALILQNENVRAVGNMGVNARGDRVDSNNHAIDAREHQVTRQYRRQHNVVDQPVATSSAKSKKVAESVAPKKSQPVQEPKPVTAGPAPLEEPVQVEAADSFTEAEGLAAAIARARNIKQEEIAPPRTASQQQDGVKKI